MNSVEEIKHKVETGSIKHITIRVRQLGEDGKERAAEYEYDVENLVDFAVDANQVYLEWTDGHSVNHNLRYVEQILDKR